MISSVQQASPAGSSDVDYIDARITARCLASEAHFARHAAGIAGCAAAMADRFFAGATLLVFGSGAGTTDAQHNSVEYVHPVVSGCRALPALSLASDVSTVTDVLAGDDPADVFAHQVSVLGSAADIALALVAPAGRWAAVRGLERARDMGMLTIALSERSGDPVPATHTFDAACDDPLIAQELHLATYHMLWELVHIVLNHRGIAETRP